MANVIIVSKHFFYNHSGTDIAMGSSASDFNAFSNMEKAVEFVEEQIKYLYADEAKFEVYNYTKNECVYQGVSEMIVYSQRLYNKDNIRHSYRIMKKKIE